jgi:diacylglycerol kinase (ATP)
MAHSKNRSFPARLGFALSGIVQGLRSERSLRTQFFAALAVLALLAWRRPEPVWWALCALATGGVLAAELINTALERLADHLHPGLHDEVRIAKDCAAGGVLLASLAALGVAAALLVHLWTMPA